MRLLVLPISTRRTLIYCEPPTQAAGASAETQSYLDKAVAKASSTWAGWEKSDTTWKKKTTEYGNRALRRIPFEEWGLKSIPALKKAQREELEALLRDRDAPGRANDRVVKEQLRSKHVEVRFPTLYQGLNKKSVTQVLQQLATERQDLHKRRMWGSILVMPLSAPFALIPLLPNFPFLFLVYRAYSHWRAQSGARHLEFLVKFNLITQSPSKELDSLYTRGLLHATGENSQNAPDPSENQTKLVRDLIQRQLESSASGSPKSGDSSVSSTPAIMSEKGEIDLHKVPTEPPQPEEIMLLRAWNGKLLAERLKLPGLEIEIDRAVEQVERDLQKQKDLKEETSKAKRAATKAGDQVKDKAGIQ